MDLLPRKRLRAAHGMEGHCVVFRRNLDLELRTCDGIMLIFGKAFSNLCSSHLWVKYCGGQQLCPLGFVEAKTAKNMEQQKVKKNIQLMGIGPDHTKWYGGQVWLGTNCR